MQAGLPVGFSQQIYDKNPQSTIVSTSHSTDVTGNDYADVITQNTKTGEMKLNKIYIGKSADQANKEADLKIKATEAETARIKALKTTVPEDQEKKDKTAQEKKDYALQKNFATDASKQVEKIRLGTTDFDTAHAILFTKYSSELAKK